MSLRDQRDRILALGSVLRHEVSGVSLEFSAPDNTRYTVEAVMSGVAEAAENGEGGILFEHSGQLRVQKALLTPAIGWMVRRAAGGKVYQVDDVTEHGSSTEWLVDISAV